MRYISFGECNKYLFYPLIGGIFNFIFNAILYLIPEKAAFPIKETIGLLVL